MKDVIVNDEWSISLPEHRAERPEWYTSEGWEKKRIIHMIEHLTSFDTLYYVGTEEGDIAGIIKKYTGCNIGLFEPNDKVWSNIKAIWEANKLSKPDFCFSGFASNADVTPEKGMSYDFPESANGALISDHGFMELHNHNAPEIKIDTVQFPCTAISIDVEGSEWEVLKGAEETILKHHPKIWLSVHPEFMFRMYEQYQQDLRNWIKDRGYKETLLDYQHEVHLYYEAL